MFKFTTIAAAVAATIITGFAAVSTAQAGEAVCGTYAFGGAFGSYSNAHRQANRIGGMVLDLDRSDSPNAGKGYYVVAKGPARRSTARQWARNWRYEGVNGAYASHRCFYVNNNL